MLCQLGVSISHRYRSEEGESASAYWQASSLGDLCDKRFRRSAIAIPTPDWPSQPSGAAHLGARAYGTCQLHEPRRRPWPGDPVRRPPLWSRVRTASARVGSKKRSSPREDSRWVFKGESRDEEQKRLGECNGARRWKIAGQLQGGPSFFLRSIFLPLLLSSALGSFRGCGSGWGNLCGVATAGWGRACRRSLGGVSVQVGRATKGLEDVTVDGTADGSGVLYAAVMRRCPARGEVGSRRGMGEWRIRLGRFETRSEAI
jgi:hypothetical protein